jgi:reverse transcriptase-like protein
MAVTAAFDLETWQTDAVNAFTNSDLDETVYCDCPEGFKLPGSCLQLFRALYGLRRSPLLWLKEFSGTLTKLGLTQVGEDLCLFANDWLIVFFYVDDIVSLCRTTDLPKLHQFKQALMKQYELKDLGELSWFLGIRIIRDRSQRRLWLCQDSYVDKIIKKFHLEYAKPAHIPIQTEELVPYEGTAMPQEIYAYQQKVGSLQYAATITRPDLARTTSKLSEFLQNPSPQHHRAADQALSYLQKTRTLAIEYSAEINSQEVFICASDAAFADDTATRRSTEGYLFKLFGGIIDWHSTKQKTVTTSSTEAELRALTHAAKETLWWKRFFQSIGLDPGHEVSISCDNQQTIGLLTKDTAKLTTKLRHIDIHHHWMRQEVQAKRIQVNWTPTAEMPADGLTKALPRQKHENFVRQLGLVDIRNRLQEL